MLKYNIVIIKFATNIITIFESIKRSLWLLLHKVGIAILCFKIRSFMA